MDWEFGGLYRWMVNPPQQMCFRLFSVSPSWSYSFQLKFCWDYIINRGWPRQLTFEPSKQCEFSEHCDHLNFFGCSDCIFVLACLISPSSPVIFVMFFCSQSNLSNMSEFPFHPIFVGLCVLSAISKIPRMFHRSIHPDEQ